MCQKILKFNYHDEWYDFIKYIQEIDNKDNRYIYRGQSNFTKNKNSNNWNPWGLQTTLQRDYDSAGMWQLLHYIKRLRKYFSKYEQLHKYIDFKKIEKINIITLLAFGRHIGLPTPLLDFTYDYLTALYFAIADINSLYGLQNDYDNDERYISIYKIDITLLKEYFNITEIDDNTYSNVFENKEIGLLLDRSKFEFQINNLNKQNGLFLYIDTNYKFELILRNRVLEEGIKINKKPIEIHRIPYKSFLSFSPQYNIYKYLTLNEKIGLYLYDDHQSILYDFKNGSFLNALYLIDLINSKKEKLKEIYREIGLKFK